MANDRGIERLPDRPEEESSDPETLKQLSESAKAVKFMDAYATFMDKAGGDILVGLVPALGDSASSVASFLVQLQQANRANLSWGDQIMMLIDQAADLGIGTVPVVGDIADFFYKSNIHSRDRFVAHFKRQLLKAWREGKVHAQDIPTLERLSGITINMPVPKPTSKKTSGDNDTRHVAA